MSDKKYASHQKKTRRTWNIPSVADASVTDTVEIAFRDAKRVFGDNGFGFRSEFRMAIPFDSIVRSVGPRAALDRSETNENCENRKDDQQQRLHLATCSFQMQKWRFLVMFTNRLYKCGKQTKKTSLAENVFLAYDDSVFVL